MPAIGRGRNCTATTCGLPRGLPLVKVRRCSACDRCRRVFSSPQSGVSLLSWHFGLPCELSPAGHAQLSPPVVSPSLPLEGQPSALLQHGLLPFALADAHRIQCTYGMSKILIS